MSLLMRAAAGFISPSSVSRSKTRDNISKISTPAAAAATIGPRRRSFLLSSTATVVLLLVNLTAAKASHKISPSLIGSTKASTSSLGLAFVTTLSRQKANSRFVDPPRRQLDLPIRTMATTATTSSSDDEINSEKSEKRLLLVGGGHAHIQVLKSLNWASRPDSLQITLVDVTSTPRYSGMVPATVAGLYEPNECQIQLKPLTEWSRINFIQGELIDIDFACAVDDAAGTSRRDTSNNESSQNFATVLVTKDEPVEDESDRQTIRIPFDVISLDIGSASRGIDDVPGAKDYTIPTRPISGLVDVIERTTAQLKERFQSSSSNPSREELATSSPFIDVVVVGGGAAGIELCMSLWGRWKPIVTEASSVITDDELFRITLLDAGNELFPQETERNRQALRCILNERSIKVRHGVKVDEVRQNELVLDGGEILPFTHCLWATGATSHPLASVLREKGLPIDNDRGWIRVNKYLQSVDTTKFPHVFAAGDCCTIERRRLDVSDDYNVESEILPSPPKAGVYAVRSGPILIQNLIRSLYSDTDRKDGDNGDGSDNDGCESRSLTPYVPQDDFLKLIVCGDGTALGYRFGVPLYGKWVFQLKDAIDRSFMDLFKPENLPELVKGQPYDVSQYDSTGNRPPPIDPVEAATLLRRTDEDVDFRKAWDVLRDMAQDDHYRDAVLKEMKP